MEEGRRDGRKDNVYKGIILDIKGCIYSSVNCPSLKIARVLNFPHPVFVVVVFPIWFPQISFCIRQNKKSVT